MEFSGIITKYLSFSGDAALGVLVHVLLGRGVTTRIRPQKLFEQHQPLLRRDDKTAITHQAGRAGPRPEVSFCFLSEPVAP